MRKAVYTLQDLQSWPEAMAAAGEPLRLAVFGDPVAHSASPAMHDAALEACGLTARYVRLRILPEELQTALRLLAPMGFIGVNLTIPHKARALPFLDAVDSHAARLGVVNTVRIEAGRLTGFNTDGGGFVRAIREEFDFSLKGGAIMILGAAGGAGRALAIQCLMEGCERLALVNRSPGKGEAFRAELAALFPDSAGRVLSLASGTEAMASALGGVGLIVNCTPAGMQADDALPMPASLLHSGLCVYDTIYRPARTALLAAAEAAGARSANGLSMLLHQGALSFEIWFGRKPPLEAMRVALREAQPELS